MKLFNKIARGANKLFQKYKADPHIFRKINGVWKIIADHTS